jgi:CRP-like cAMP-binding protein
VLAGSVLMVVDSVEGKELVLNRHGIGELFGEVSLFDGEGRSASAVAYEPSQLIHIDRDRLLAVLRQRPDALLRVVQLVCARMRRVTSLVEDSLFLDVSTRLARLIVALAAARAAAGEGGATLRLSQNDLARMLGASREFVSKQLVHWRDSGIVELGRRRLTITDAAALARLCGEDTSICR